MSPTPDELDVPALRQLLREANVPETAYCLPGAPFFDGAYVLAHAGRVWSTYFNQGGERVEMSSFLSESEACEELLRRLRQVFPSIPAGPPRKKGAPGGAWPTWVRYPVIGVFAMSCCTA